MSNWEKYRDIIQRNYERNIDEGMAYETGVVNALETSYKQITQQDGGLFKVIDWLTQEAESKCNTCFYKNLNCKNRTDCTVNG